MTNNGVADLLERIEHARREWPNLNLNTAAWLLLKDCRIQIERLKDRLALAEQRAFLAAGIAYEQAAKVLDGHAATLDQRFRPNCAEDRYAAEIRSLIPNAAEVEKVMVYAERYRWLRRQHWSNGVLFVVEAPESIALGTNCPSLELLDAAIDAKREE